jgi:hypothetical protein
MPFLTFFLSPLGRYVAIALAALAIVGGAYTKGRLDGRASYKAKIERQIKDAVEKGTDARDRALRDLDAGRVPNDWFRDE